MSLLNKLLVRKARNDKKVLIHSLLRSQSISVAGPELKEVR